MDKNPASVESMPHICKKIAAMWGTPEVEAFINTLIMDSRGGGRAGFPKVVELELLWLEEASKWRRALDLHEKENIDLAEARARIRTEDEARVSSAFDEWGLPIAEDASGSTASTIQAGTHPGRRYTDRQATKRPRRRREENTAFGIVIGFVTSKYVLLVIVAVLALKAMWPTLKLFL